MSDKCKNGNTMKNEWLISNRRHCYRHVYAINDSVEIWPPISFNCPWKILQVITILTNIFFIIKPFRKYENVEKKFELYTIMRNDFKKLHWRMLFKRKLQRKYIIFSYIIYII